MQMNDMVIVSVDDHIIEPPGIFDRTLPARWQDRAPRFVDSHGSEGAYWTFEGTRVTNFALNAVAGRPREELGFEPDSYDQIRKGCWEVNARVDDMNVNGVLSALCFGSFTGFAGEIWTRAQDKELSLACLKAYNDWHIDEWCGAHPGRFIPLAQLPMWDPNLCAEEVRRVARKGATAVTFIGLPQQLGLPSVHTQAWDPLFAACQEENVAMCLHIGAAPLASLDSPVDSYLSQVGISSFMTASEWLWSHSVRRFPNMKIVLSEGGIGWIPYFLERADQVFENHGPWTRNTDFGGVKPSEYFRKRFFSCFIVDRTGLKHRHEVGIDTITFENDYPHADITWPKSPEQLWADFQAAGCTDEEIEKITHLTAMRALNVDPIARLGGRANCTVGALRAKATHVDLTELRNVGGIPPAPPGRTPTMADIARQFPTVKAANG
ncbi:MAG: amidohydrolase family protein [Gammaproteobacteria bacterium]